MLKEMNANRKVELFDRFTQTYKRWSDDTGRREIECMRIQYPLWMHPIGADDLFAGRGEFDCEIGFTPQALINKFGYYIDIPKSEKLLADPALTPHNRALFENLIRFWQREETVVRLRARYPEKMAITLPSDNWQGEPGMAFPLYRMSGTQLDLDRLLHRGIPGLEAEIRQAMTAADEGTRAFYTNLLEALKLFGEVASHYARIAREMAAGADAVRAGELETMALTLEKITQQAPLTLYEAIQLSYLYCQFSGSINFGRMDEYLGDFLAADLAAGRHTEESAIRLLVRYWQVIDKRGRVYDSRLTIGGRGRRNEENADQFALLAIEATRRARTLAPQVTLRFYAGQNPSLMSRALDAVGEGCTFPMLYNDEVNIPAVAASFNLPETEAVDYIPFGCGEYTIYHKSVGTPSGVINLLQILLTVLREAGFATFEELLNAYFRKVEEHVEQLALQEELEYDFAGETAPFPLLSMLYDDCLLRAKPVFSGGVRYLGGTLESYGGTNTADSLVAIRELVFEKRCVSLKELTAALDADFEGYGKLRAELLKCPKYGNDDNTADAIKVLIDGHICRSAADAGRKTKMHTYRIVFINNDANTILGRHTGASPDGRKAGMPMANGNGPTGGYDKNGVTALLNSLVKPAVDIHAGAVQNLKLSRELFRDQRPRLEALLTAYFRQGGAQLMITVTDRGELERALKEPQNYQNLIVRVGGFSARFVELSPDVQQEILSRTLY